MDSAICNWPHHRRVLSVLDSRRDRTGCRAWPGLDGGALARAVLAVRPQLPLLIYSGHLTEALAAKLVQIGVRDILQKPTSLAEITRQVARHLAV